MASLQFSNITTKEGLIQECEIKLFGDNGYGKISGDSNLLLQFTSRLNRALEKEKILAFTADGTWQEDDSNYTDFDIATTNLTVSQQDISFNADQMIIEKILVKDSAGTWHELKPFNETDEDAKTYFENPSTGFPTKYNKRGKSLIFNTIPSYSVEGGVKAYFKRGPSYFTSTDTTKVAGIPSILSPYLVVNACMGYAKDRSLANKNDFINDNVAWELEVKSHYSRRPKDERPGFRSSRVNSTR